VLLPTLALACGFLFKQTAIIFALPYWLWLIVSNGPSRNMPHRPTLINRCVQAAASAALFTVVVLVVSLPFLFRSGDYVYMTLQYVSDVPLQTQSWLVALAGIFGPDFLLLRLSSWLLLLASAAISFLSARRGSSLYLTATLITLAFFLLSQKVVGYYYVILLPFALAALLPNRRFGLLTLMVTGTAYISLSPYFASWANPGHLPFYAALGIANSLLWVVLFVYLWRDLPLPLLAKEGRAANSPLPAGEARAANSPLPAGEARAANSPLLVGEARAANSPLPVGEARAANSPLLVGETRAANSPFPVGEGRTANSPFPVGEARAANSPLPVGEARAANSPLLAKEGQGEVRAFTLAFLSIALFLEAVAAALLQPLVNNPTSPIRAPIIPPGLGSNVFSASVVFAVVILAVFICAAFCMHRLASADGGLVLHSNLARGVFAVLLALAPVYFLTFTLTKESTAVAEMALKSLGL
jgi:hypothetical protein